MRNRGSAGSQGEPDLIVIGVGNPLRGDDGVGRRVAQFLRPWLPGTIAVRECSGEAIELMEAWAGYAHALVVDAARGAGAPGTVHRIEVGNDPLPVAIGGISVHGLGLAEAVGLARALDRMPGRLVVYAIEGCAFGPGSELSDGMEAGVESAARLILDDVRALPDTAQARQD